MTDPRITKMNYELRLMELQMASLLPKPPQEINAAQQYNILQQIKEDTSVTISIPNLEAMINHAYEARINHLESLARYHQQGTGFAS